MIQLELNHFSSLLVCGLQSRDNRLHAYVYIHNWYSMLFPKVWNCLQTTALLQIYFWGDLSNSYPVSSMPEIRSCLPMSIQKIALSYATHWVNAFISSQSFGLYSWAEISNDHHVGSNSACLCQQTTAILFYSHTYTLISWPVPLYGVTS